MKLTIPNKQYSLTELYDTVASIIGRETKDLQYDCREINIAPNIQENFFKYYRGENPNLSETDFRTNMVMLLLCYGPKVDETLQENEVEVFDGFIC